jgi:hypothetical protein
VAAVPSGSNRTPTPIPIKKNNLKPAAMPLFPPQIPHDLKERETWPTRWEASDQLLELRHSPPTELPQLLLETGQSRKSQRVTSRNIARF